MRFSSRSRVAAGGALALHLVLYGLAAAHDSLPEQIAAANRAVRERPGSAEPYLRRGELHRLAQDWDAARADYTAAARCDPVPAEIDLCWGALHLDTGAPEEALAVLDRFLVQWPEHPDALELKSRALHDLGRDPEAIAALSGCIAARDAPRPDLYLQRARLQMAVAGTDPDLVLRGLQDGTDKLGRVVALEQLAFEVEVASGRQEAAQARLERTAARIDPEPARLAAAPDAAANAAPVPPTSAAAIPLPRGSTWKYSATGIDLGSGWRAVGFDDSAWPSGPAPLGYGESYIATPVPFGPNSNSRWITTYLRTTFPITVSPATITALSLAVNYDDGFVAYLNGQEVARRSLPAGPITAGTLASSHEGGAYETIDLQAFATLLVQGTNLLAVEIHQAAASSSDLVLDMELAYGLRMTRGPYLQIATPNSVRVRWRTNVATPSRVLYGSAPNALLNSISDPTPTIEHDVRVGGLSPNSRTYYAVGTNSEVLAGADANHYVDAWPLPGTQTTTRIWILGDSGQPGAGQNAVRDAYYSFTGPTATNVWLMLGDNAYDAGTDAEFQAGLFDPYAALLRHCALWPTRGNHEVLYGGPSNDYYDLFTLPTGGEAGGVASGTEAYYSFDHTNIHFVCLDSEGSDRSPAGAMCTWLRADLSANDSDWTIAFWHHPPYTKGSHNSDNDADSGGRMRDMRANVLPILDSLGVDLVLTGHSHSYERSWLLDGHYGPSSTLVPEMILDHGDGRPGSDGAYAKPSAGPAAHEGAVHTVAGSSSHTGGGTLNHPAMFTSLNVQGSLVLDVVNRQLTARFLDDAGAVRDQFVITKGPPGVPTGVDLDALVLEHGEPNPARGSTRVAYVLPGAGAVRLTLHDAAGRRVATLVDGAESSGPHAVVWNGRDDHGRGVAPGVYFARLQFGDRVRQRKIVMTH